MMNATATVAYVTLFAVVAFLFVFIALLLGRLLRPHVPSAMKQETYECGEPTVGSSFVQFDLRFYVVALLFIIFEVEAAFFFPWAAVFGTAARISSPVVAEQPESPGELSATIREGLAGLGVQQIAAPSAATPTSTEARVWLRNLARLAMLDVAVFFAVLLVGFAYVWRRGDLDWVRAIGKPTAAETLARDAVSAPAA